MKTICENLSLTEVVGDSSYIDPIRIKVKVNTGDARFKKDYDLQQAVVNAISRSTLTPEILVDESDGTYQLCFPGRSDWLKAIQDTVQYNITSKARLEIRESLTDAATMNESISESQVAQVLQDAREQAEEFGTTSEFTDEYYIGSSVSAAGYPLNKLFMFLPDHVSETDKEYCDAVRGWKENEGIDSLEENNFIPDDDF